jgi:hypothetical protein
MHINGVRMNGLQVGSDKRETKIQLDENCRQEKIEAALCKTEALQRASYVHSASLQCELN